ncbi:hypothetical protein [Amycolatopsis sp. NPDC051372]|uniref:hypothetical protein n=1 Tax=Amycolatopsis sp. NPDC051372 TaxID=3155669 RepID=UPI0034288CDF
MNELVNTAARSRAEQLRKRLRRHKLVFVQCGIIHDVLRDAIVESLSAVRLDVRQFLYERIDIQSIESGTLVLDSVELLAQDQDQSSMTLGKLRQEVDRVLDSDVNVCLLSRTPRVGFGNVPGSSVIEDASVYFLPLLESSEWNKEMSGSPGLNLPSCGIVGRQDFVELFRVALTELGLAVLAALDSAIFEAPPGVKFLERLDVREIDALQGAGLVALDGDGVRQFAVPNRISEFKEALSDVLSDITEPQSDFSAISERLWSIERTIRRCLREAAISKYGNRWRSQVLHGDLAAKVLEHARADVNVSARTIAELRDPSEWLSLGELMEVANSKDFDGLHFDKIAWGKFREALVPIRNRVSHMRLVRKGDKEIVEMWFALVRRHFG